MTISLPMGSAPPLKDAPRDKRRGVAPCGVIVEGGHDERPVRQDLVKDLPGDRDALAQNGIIGEFGAQQRLVGVLGGIGAHGGAQRVQPLHLDQVQVRQPHRPKEDMQVAVVEPRQHRAPLCIDHLGIAPGQRHKRLSAHRKHAAPLQRHRSGAGRIIVHGQDACIVKDHRRTAHRAALREKANGPPRKATAIRAARPALLHQFGPDPRVKLVHLGRAGRQEMAGRPSALRG